MPEKPQVQPDYHAPAEHEEDSKPMREEKHESPPSEGEKPEKSEKPETPEKPGKPESTPEYSLPKQHQSLSPPSLERPAEQPENLPEEEKKIEMPKGMPKEVPKMQSSYAPSMPMPNEEAVQHAAPPHKEQQPAHAPAMQDSYMQDMAPQWSRPQMSNGGSGYPMQAQRAQSAMMHHQQSYAPAVPVSQPSQNHFAGPGRGAHEMLQTHGYPMQPGYMQAAAQPVSMPEQNQQPPLMPQANHMVAPAAMPQQHGEDYQQSHSYGMAPAAPVQQPQEHLATPAAAPDASYMKASSQPAMQPQPQHQPQPQPQPYEATTVPKKPKEEEKPNVSYQHD